MKTIHIFLLLIIPVYAFSQQAESSENSQRPSHKLGIGIKAGLNFSNITHASAINATSKTGFHAGILLDAGGGILGSHTELLYSQQGYNYTSNDSTVSKTHDYIVLAQMVRVNITKFVQIQMGMQIGYLLHATKDSSQTTGNASVDKALSIYNSIDYGIGGGLEIHPVGSFLVGARYNLSLSNLYKQGFSGTQSTPTVNFRNNLVQLFIGYKF